METLESSALGFFGMARMVARTYFRPLLDFIGYITTPSSDKVTNEKQKNDKKTLLLATEVITRAIWLNQGKYLQYAFLAAERHRALKEELAKSDPQERDVARKANALVDFMNKEFFEAVQENFSVLHTYFGSRSSTPPRICVKGNFRVGGSDRVITVFRDRVVPYTSNVKIDRNSGFSHVERTGKYFLENDILISAGNGRYINPRLDSNSVKHLSRTHEVQQAEWEKCWRDATSAADCYRSTLIVPMTLRENEFSSEFKRLVRINDVGRPIFGYLCIDHSEPNYFDEENDVRVGYVFADILSMYLFSRMINIEVSKTYEKARTFLVDYGLTNQYPHVDEPKFEGLYKTIAKLIDLKFKVSESSENTLVPLDKDLLRYVGINSETISYESDDASDTPDLTTDKNHRQLSQPRS